MKEIVSLRSILVLVLSVLIGFFTHQYLPTGIADGIKATVTTASTVAGTLFGFTLTALSILGSLWNRQLIENMRRTGHFNQLLSTLAQAGVAALLIMILGMFVALVPPDWLNRYFSAMVGVFVYACYLNLLALRRFYLVLRYA